MLKVESILVAVLLLGAGTIRFAAAGRHVSVELYSVIPEILGTVDLTELPKGTNVILKIRGLSYDTEYISEFHQQQWCPSPASGLVGSFKTNSDGKGIMQAKLDTDLSEIGSISVRRPSDSQVEACGNVSP